MSNELSSEGLIFYANEVEQTDHARRASFELEFVFGLLVETKVEDCSSVREAKSVRGEPAHDWSGETPIPSAEETLIILEILVVPQCEYTKFNSCCDL